MTTWYEYFGVVLVAPGEKEASTFDGGTDATRSSELLGRYDEIYCFTPSFLWFYFLIFPPRLEDQSLSRIVATDLWAMILDVD